MYNMKKNQIIITALVIMIVVAGFINYNDKNQTAFNENIGVNNELFETSSIMNEEFEFFNIPDTTLTDKGDTEEDKDDKEDNDKDKEDVEETGASNNGEDQPGTAIFVDSSAVITNYFAEEKLLREQVRAKQKEDLFSIITNDDISQESKNEATERMLQLQDKIMKESEIEVLLESKGFKNVYVMIDEEDVDIIVDRATLTESDLAKIEDIVTRKTGRGVDKIKISPVNPQN